MVFKESKFVASGLLPGPRNGQMSMYNMRADPKLPVHQIAMRRIPYACLACVEQTSKEWRPNQPFEEQDRYLQNPNCRLWPIFEGLNDWSLVTLKAGQEPDHEESLLMNKMVLGKLTEYLLDEIHETADLLDDTSDAPIIKLVNHIMAQAIKAGASDIHIEPYQQSFKVRYRVSMYRTDD